MDQGEPSAVHGADPLSRWDVVAASEPAKPEHWISQRFESGESIASVVHCVYVRAVYPASESRIGRTFSLWHSAPEYLGCFAV